MGQRHTFFVSLDESDQPIVILAAAALGLPAADLAELQVVRRSLDARKGRRPGYWIEVELRAPNEAPVAPAPDLPIWPAGRPRPHIVVVGSGPAGSWAALTFARMGLGCTILEQGKPVQPRRHDLARLQRGTLEPTSNYCFGEGGAGTYSDGKLYTRVKDRARVRAVLADLIRFGAPPEIAFESRPHVGSNRLPKVLAALRSHLESLGVTYRFETGLLRLLSRRGVMRAVLTTAGDEIPADIVVLAVGHSARSVYAELAQAGVALARKPFAVGVRMEHPQPLIDRMQYGPAAGHPRLPPAFYELKAQGAGRSVYSFCMCPGGWIVPAATEPDGVVVNGMSLSRRDSPFANAGMVVTIDPRDVDAAGSGVLAGVEFQRRIERASFSAGGGGFRAAAQRLDDFLLAGPGQGRARITEALPRTSYRPGLMPASLASVLPAPVVQALFEGLSALCRRLPMLRTPEAVLVAGETRTSAPVRILRDAETLQSPGLVGLYPAGEGAGYAGGIVSAAIDGARVAESAICARLWRGY